MSPPIVSKALPRCDLFTHLLLSFPTRRSSDLRYGNDAGFCAQLTYRNTTNSPQNVRLGWQGQWEEVAIRQLDRKSTRLNSSHVAISYAVFCVKKHNDLVIRLPTGTTCSLRLYF